MAFNTQAVGEFFGQTNRALDIGITDGHRLTHQYDSYRAYSWIIRIPNIAGILGTVDTFGNFSDDTEQLTLACRKITGLGFSVETIEANKINDRFYYPGRPSTQTATITFDNLIRGDTAKILYTWMRTSYDPIFGVHSSPVLAGDQFKRTVEIVQLDHTKNPKLIIKLYGAFPLSYKVGELDYGSNNFATIDMDLKYDFLTQYRVEDNIFENFLGNLIPGVT